MLAGGALNNRPTQLKWLLNISSPISVRLLHELLTSSRPTYPEGGHRAGGGGYRATSNAINRI